MLTKLKQLLPILFILLVFSISIWSINNELKNYTIDQIWGYLQNIPKLNRLLALVFTILGYSVMTGYDLLGFKHIQQQLAPLKIAFTAFVSYAIGNTIGFTAFSGTAIRYRYYGLWGVSKLKIAELIVFTHLTFWLGLLTISGIVCLVDPVTLPNTLHLPFKSLKPLGVIFLLVILFYFFLSFTVKHSWKIGKEEVYFPKPIISLGTIMVSMIDWGLAAGVLYQLLPSHSTLTYIGFFGIYIIALTAGLISTVPGGLGVFETVILFLRPVSISAHNMLGALIAYRIVYFILPLIVALIVIAIETMQINNKKNT